MKYQLIQGDCLEVLKTLSGQSVNCCVTSPPYYGLRDYNVEGQIGLEQSPDEYVAKLVDVFREVKRVLRDDGTLWLNLGDSYAGANTGASRPPEPGHTRENDGRVKTGNENKHTRPSMVGGNVKPKDMVGIPWRVAFALQADGWYLRSDIIWHKPNPMPESVKDRPTKAHEYIFLLAKSEKYYYDAESIKVPSKNPLDDRGARNNRKRFPTEQINGIRGPGLYAMANKRSVWTVNTKPFKEAHFAVFPPNLIKPCILAGSPKDGTVLDPFNGSGTTGVVSVEYGRSYIGIDLNPEYIEMAERRISKVAQQGILL